MQLINCTNTKCNYFGHESADLVVDKRERVSAGLLAIINKQKVFNNIYIVDLCSFFDKNENEKKKGIVSFFRHFQYRKCFLDELDHLIRGKKYDLFLTAAFWSETLNIYQYLKKNNNKIFIEVVEEGMANYDGPESWIYRAAPSCAIKALIREILYCRSLGWLVRKRVQCLYLYKSELSWTHRKENVKRLPVIDDHNPVLYKIFREWHQSIDYSLYEDNKYMYIVDAPQYNEGLYKAYVNMIRRMPERIKNISVIKQHPLYISNNDKEIFLNEDGVWVDGRKTPIESMLFQCDVDQKVLIVNRSSVLLYLIGMLNKEPYVVLTYRLKEFCGEERTSRFIYFVEKLQTIYSNPDKIIIPNSLNELQDALTALAK